MNYYIQSSLSNDSEMKFCIIYCTSTIFYLFLFLNSYHLCLKIICITTNLLYFDLF